MRDDHAFLLFCPKIKDTDDVALAPSVQRSEFSDELSITYHNMCHFEPPCLYA